MRKTAVFIVFLLCTRTASAQCDLHSKRDDFDGSVTYWTDQVKIASDGVGILADQMDCTFMLFLHFVYGKNKTVLVLAEKQTMCNCSPVSISVKFADGTVLTKANVRRGQERSTGIGEEEQSSYFDLTQDELTLLSGKEISKVRVREMYCSDHPVLDAEVTKKASRNIKEHATCISAKSK